MPLSRNHSASFWHAIWTWEMFGKVEDIAWVLRSGRALTQNDREWLADYIEKKISLPPMKPPFVYLLQGHKTMAVKAAANEVSRLISEWTAAGQKRRGLKAKAIELAAAKCCPPDRGLEEFEESLVVFLNRAKRAAGDRQRVADNFQHGTRE